MLLKAEAEAYKEERRLEAEGGGGTAGAGNSGEGIVGIADVAAAAAAAVTAAEDFLPSLGDGVWREGW